jgi:O-antigen ligase
MSQSVARASSPHLLTTVGFALYCAYLLSGFANDWSIKLLGGKAYISTITLLLLPAAWLLSGNALRGLRHPIGPWWTAFLFWLALATPFSVWKSGSAMLLWNYVPRGYLCFFYTCAFVTTPRRCRYFMYVNVIGALLLLLTCMQFGEAGADAGGTRFHIPQSLFYENANDLALALLLGAPSFLFLFSSRGAAQQIVGAAGAVLSLIYALKTGSRGCLLAAAVLMAVTFIVSRNRIRLAILAAPTLGLAAWLVPSSTVHRLSLVAPTATETESSADLSSASSQAQRTALLKKSLDYTFSHPLLGVGPDQFAVAVDREAAEAGQHVPWLGTHNTYAQISSECGVPALIFYCAVIVLCLRGNYRLYRKTRGDAAFPEASRLSLCLLAGMLVYAVSGFFFHMAYSGNLPLLAGFTAAVQLAAADHYRAADGLPSAILKVQKPTLFVGVGNHV